MITLVLGPHRVLDVPREDVRRSAVLDTVMTDEDLEVPVPLVMRLETLELALAFLRVTRGHKISVNRPIVSAALSENVEPRSVASIPESWTWSQTLELVKAAKALNISDLESVAAAAAACRLFGRSPHRVFSDMGVEAPDEGDTTQVLMRQAWMFR